MEVFAFTKLFKPAPAAEAFKKIKSLGFTGLDLTVRKGGYADPEGATWEKDWADCRSAWEAAACPPGMFSSDILSLESPHAKDIITAAEKYKVKYIKLGYAHLKFGELREGLAKWRKDILDMVPFAEDHGVTLMIHVHAANYAGALPFHWLPIFDATDSPAIRMYPDPCNIHMESVLQGWWMALEMAKDKIAVVAVKDYRWHNPYKKPEQGSIYPIFTRLEKGNVPWNQVVYALKKLNFSGPFSMHGEFSDSDRHNVPEGMKKDLEYFTALWNAPVGEMKLTKEKMFETED